MNVLDIAIKLGYELCGDKSIEVCGISFAPNASHNQIAVAFSEKDIQQTNASVVLTAPTMCRTDKTLMFCYDSVGGALVKMAKVFIEAGVYKDYSIPVRLEKCGDYFIGTNCQIADDAYIGCSAVIEDDVVIGSKSVVSYGAVIKSGCRIGNNVHIGCNCVIGADAFYTYGSDNSLFSGIGISVLEDDVYVGNCTCIERGTLSDTVIKSGTKISNFVQVGHDTIIGRNCKVVSQCALAGNVTLGNNVTLYAQSGVKNDIRIGDGATVYAKSGVSKNISHGAEVSGMYARDHVQELRTLAKVRKL